MGQRLELHQILMDLLGTGFVYFQPPATTQMRYPAIVYKRDYVKTEFADNDSYRREKRYLVTVIDPDPDSDISDRVGALPKCVFDRAYTTNNLNHDVYRLFF